MIVEKNGKYTLVCDCCMFLQEFTSEEEVDKYMKNKRWYSIQNRNYCFECKDVYIK